VSTSSACGFAAARHWWQGLSGPAGRGSEEGEVGATDPVVQPKLRPDSRSTIFHCRFRHSRRSTGQAMSSSSMVTIA
jgi:hypothetical protein